MVSAPTQSLSAIKILGVTQSSAAVSALSIKHSRLPPGLPQYNTDGKEPAFLFLKKLELILDSEGYPKTRWGRALAIQVTGTGTHWVLSTLSENPDWGQVLSQFLAHFDHPDQRFILQQRISSMTQNSGESVRQYSDWFLDLADQLGGTEES